MRNPALLLLVLLFLDLYLLSAVKANWNQKTRLRFNISFGAIALLGYAFLLYLGIFKFTHISPFGRNVMLGYIMITYITKIVALPFYLIDDLRRGFVWIKNQLITPKRNRSENGITRNEFINKIAIFSAGLPFITLSWGTLNGAYNYRIRRVEIFFENLPFAFNGYKIVQLSDIHTGSLSDVGAVKGGIAKVLAENPDLIVFTGDLVNNKTDEAYPWMPILSQLNAPDGVFSVLGNHDYGDYHPWNSVQEKEANLQAMHQLHADLGWRLLLNEHVILERNGAQIGLIGVENWGDKARFPKYGKLPDACANMADVPFKMLLSHDPSHWDAQVRPQKPDIDLTLAGHTHGMQFGVEIPGVFKWSPASFTYQQWAGLYKTKNQYLYVNRGFGFIGYPGRVGIMPEITVITLKSGKQEVS